ncbi:hypothetical protein F5876DRAFT_67003 [Lentinula aff. lateritia]|uniref:Uncharacterized protein n=1 Tax=Lentinula aff. lateritia TaxID=2804960 RepID=A0ACC1TVJ0_9AGAR|nr:hypothetical protein F5876DRAFT_67003 [Lentinula aff. lateritia]
MNAPNVHIMQRQVLGSVLGGVGSIVSGLGSGINSAVSGVGAGVTSGLGDITSAVLPTITSYFFLYVRFKYPVGVRMENHFAADPPYSTFSSSSTITSTSSTITPTSSAITSRSTSSSVTSLSSPTTASSSSTDILSSSASIYTSTSDGVRETITAFVTPSASPSPSQSSVSSANGFLNNKPLEGFVFALCGIVGIVILFLVTTFALRRSRRKRMLNEALSYEPTTTHGYTGHTDRDVNEKTRASYSSAGSSSNELANGSVIAGGYYSAPGMGPQADHQYEREYPAYAPPRSPNPAYDNFRSYGSSYNYNMSGPPVMAGYIPPVQPAFIQPILASNSTRVPVPAMSPDSAAAAASAVIHV